MPARFGTGPNLADSATLTGDPATGYLAANLQDRLAGRIYRANTNDDWMVIDLGSAQAVGMIGLAGHNLTRNGIFQAQANTADSWSSPAWDSGADEAFPGIPCIFYPDVNYRYWRLRMKDSSLSKVEARWLGVSSYIELTRGIAYGFQLRPVSSRAVTVTQAGTPQRSGGSQHFVRAGQVSGLNYDEVYDQIMALAGTDRRPIFSDLMHGQANGHRYRSYGAVKVGGIPHDNSQSAGAIGLEITDLRADNVASLGV